LVFNPIYFFRRFDPAATSSITALFDGAGDLV
jgi:hypothetical protein